jgi:hypothetical protein
VRHAHATVHVPRGARFESSDVQPRVGDGAEREKPSPWSRRGNAGGVEVRAYDDGGFGQRD